MLLDTSGVLSLCDENDAFHQEAVRLFGEAGRCVIHNYVLAEFIPLAQVRGLPRKDVLGYLRRLLDDPSVELHWIDKRAHRAAFWLLERRTDKTYSLCDAVSFVLVRQLGVNEALTTDRHFEQKGFVRLLKG